MARQRLRTILVLSGGGVRGCAHVGVWRALERLGIAVDEVVGTSMGAVAGAGIAAGRSASQLEGMFADLAAGDCFRPETLRDLVHGARSAARTRGERYLDFLRRHLPADFASLQRPLLCNTLSLSTGRTRHFGFAGAPEVPLAEAVYASSCLPGVFEPREIAGEHCIDGGMAEPLALRLAEARSADLILAVDLSRHDYHVPAPLRAEPAQLLWQTYEVMGGVLAEHALHRYGNRAGLVLIKPHVADVELLDFTAAAEVARRGEREALHALATHPVTRYLCPPDLVKDVDRQLREPREYVHLEVDASACINCGICAATCTTQGYAAVPIGSVVRKLFHYECTRDAACERNCPTGAIRLGNL